MLLRLTPAYGGDGTVHGIIAMNDTGSDVLTLFNTDLALLGNIHGYMGWRLPAFVGDCSLLCLEIITPVHRPKYRPSISPTVPGGAKAS